MRYAECHPDLPYYAKGFCRLCYAKHWKGSNPEASRAIKRREYAKNKDRYLSTAKVYYQAHRERIIARVAAWQDAHPTRHRESRILRDYGMTADEYREHVIGQAGRCLICLRVPANDLVIDHDHKTGRVRGLLCHHCNRALGHLRDNAEVARSAAAYLGRQP